MNNDSFRAREQAVRQILSRNISLSNEEEEKENFLLEIGIPSIWLHEVKAALSLKDKKYKIAVQHLIQGQFYNKAHDVS